MEHHRLVNPVQELGPEIVLQLVGDRVLDVLGRLADHGLDDRRANVAGHDDDGVLEVHRSPLAVGQPAVVQHLQQHVEHVRMGLFNLVEQQHAVGLAPHSLGQVAALLVAHITRRRANQAGDRMLFHELAHVHADQVVFTVEHEAGQRLAQFGFADARGAKEQEGAGRAVRVAQPRPRAANGIGDGLNRLVLANDALVQLALHLQQLVFFALHHLGDRNAGGAADDLGDFLGADLRAHQFWRFAGPLVGLAVLRGFQPFFKFWQLAVLQFGHLVEVALAGKFFNLKTNAVALFQQALGALVLGFFGLPDFIKVGNFLLQLDDFFLDQAKAFQRRFIFLAAHRFALDLQLNQPAVQPVQDFRFGIDLDPDLGRRFVDQVNRLVGQKAVGDVAVAQLGRCNDGRVGDLHAVVRFVLFLQAAQDGNRRLHRRLAHQDFLEAALQRGVFFNVLAVFVQRGRADAVQLAARQGGLEHIARVHRALGLAGAHHGVQLVDENDGLALVLGQFLEHVFQPFLELAAKLGAGQQRGHVQAQHALALERIGHFASDDALGQAFDNGGLADARLANQHRVVLGAALQHLNSTANLVVAADHRVELAQPRALGQVNGVLGERFTLAFCVGAVDVLPAAHGINRRFQGFAGQTVLAGDFAHVSLAVGQRQQEQLAGNELVIALDGFLFGGLQQPCKFLANLDLVLALHLRQLLDSGIGGLHKTVDVDAGPLQQRARTVFLAQHGGQQMRRLDVVVVVGQGQGLGFAQRFLKLGGEFVLSHGISGRT